MPVSSYYSQVEPEPGDAIWRFMRLSKFRDLMASEELYFRRADLFDDKTEGIPPELWAMKVPGHDPYDVNHRAELNNTLGSIAQHRESYFISCWHLYREETLGMWEQYGDDGVAIVSRYELLKEAMNGLLDEAHLGKIRCGADHLERFNTDSFITTKQVQYAPERELRAWIVCQDNFCGGNRHFDLNNVPHPYPLPINPRHKWVQDGKKRRIDMKALIQEVVISPWADKDDVAEIHMWAKGKGFPSVVRPSSLTSPRARQAPKPSYVPDVPATEHEVTSLSDKLSTVDDDHLRFLYKQRWAICEICSDGLPRISDVQYLEATLRLIHERKNAAEAAREKAGGRR